MSESMTRTRIHTEERDGHDARVEEKASATPGEAKRDAQPQAEEKGGFDIEALVGYILLVGVLSSITLIVAGLAWHLGRTGELGIDYSFAGMNFFQFMTRDITQFFTDPVRPRMLVSLGIAMLMLTPFVRVLASMVYFLIAERNWKYALFTAFVLAVLTYSLFLR